MTTTTEMDATLLVTKHNGHVVSRLGLFTQSKNPSIQPGAEEYIYYPVQSPLTAEQIGYLLDRIEETIRVKNAFTPSDRRPDTAAAKAGIKAIRDLFAEATADA